MSKAQIPAAFPPLLCSIPHAARTIGLSRSRVYELIAEQRIRAVKDGRRRLVLVASLHEFVQSLCDTAVAPPKNGGWQC